MSFFTYHIKYSSFGELGAKTNITLKPTDVDNSTSLQLPGQGKTNYGEFYNQNILALMEHFAKSTPPARPTTGQIWYQPYIIVPATNPPNIPNPTCGQTYTPPGGDCSYIDPYCDLTYVDNTYLESLTCIPTNINISDTNTMVYDCTTHQWMQRKYVHKVRYYTNSVMNQDPDYPGWTLLQHKYTQPPQDPKCGDTYFNSVDSNMYFWNCAVTPNKWDILGTNAFVKLNGSSPAMTGVLHLTTTTAIDAATSNAAVSKAWAVRKAGDTTTGPIVLISKTDIDNAGSTNTAVSKAWAVRKDGDTMGGPLLLSGPAAVGNGAVTLSQMTGITDPLTTSVNTALNQVVPIGGIIMWSGSTVPTGWHICDGTNGTPNLIDRFIVGSGGIHPVGSNGAGSTVAVTSTPPTATLPPFYALAFIMKM